MYVEVIARQGIEEVQFCCMPGVVSLGDSAASAARIIVVLMTAAEATAAFTLARFLAVSDTRIWLVCPVTRTLLGRLRTERFLRFAKRCTHALPADTLKPVEEFTSAHPLFWFGASTKNQLASRQRAGETVGKPCLWGARWTGPSTNANAPVSH
jgi:hypothetical protein